MVMVVEKMKQAFGPQYCGLDAPLPLDEYRVATYPPAPDGSWVEVYATLMPTPAFRLVVEGVEVRTGAATRMIDVVAALAEELAGGMLRLVVPAQPARPVDDLDIYKIIRDVYDVDASHTQEETQ